MGSNYLPKQGQITKIGGEDDLRGFKQEMGMSGPKSRDSYAPGLCMKFDCANRDVKCVECLRFSEYEANEEAKHDKDADMSNSD